MAAADREDTGVEVADKDTGTMDTTDTVVQEEEEDRADTVDRDTADTGVSTAEPDRPWP